MSRLLSGRNILVMGVANKWSIAWGISEQLYKHGANLIFSYYGERSLQSLEKLTKDMAGVSFIECDVTNDEEIAKTFELIKND